MRRKHTAKCPYCKKDHGDGAPWWNKSRSGWFLTYRDEAGKQRQKLLAKGYEGHDEAIRVWGDQRTGVAPIIPLGAGDSIRVEVLIEKRLEYLEATAKPGTFKNHKGWLVNFRDHPRWGCGKLTVAEMRTVGIARIKQWAAAHAWNDSTKESVFKCIKAMFNFATDKSEDSLGLIDSSPVAKLNTGRTRLRGTARVSVFSAEQEAAILANADPRGIYPQFATAFRLLIATGARPEELCSVTAADVRQDPSGDLYWLVQHKNQKRTGARRRIYLTAEAQEITRAALTDYPSGKLFRNCWGVPWDKDSLYQAFRRTTRRPACKMLGLDDHDLGERTNGSSKRGFRYVLYTCRHTFAHRHLTGYYTKADGTPLVLNYGEVAELLGNSAAEVEKTYGKLAKATTYLGQLVKRA